MPDRLPMRFQKIIEEFVARGEQLGRLQERVNGLVGAVIGLADDLSVDGVLDRLAGSARSLAGATHAEVHLEGPVWVQRSLIAADEVDQEVPTLGAFPADGEYSHPVDGERRPQGDSNNIRGSSLRRPAEASRTAADGEHSILSAPLRAHGTTLGELKVWNKREGSFAPEAEEILAALASAAGPAIWNALLYQESQRRQAWLEAVLDAGDRLVSGEDLNPGNGFDVVVDCARRASQSAMALVLVPDSGRFRVGAAAGTLPTQRVLDLLPRPRQWDREAAGAQVGNAVEWFGADAAQGFGQVLLVGLGEGGPAGGVILLAKHQGESYTPMDLSSAALFGSNVGLAMRLRALAQQRGEAVLSSDRRRIALDLHDLVIQRLFAGGLSLQRIVPLGAQPKAAGWAAQVVHELDAAIQDLRQAVHALGFDLDELESEAFTGRLIEAVRRASESEDFEVEITIEGPVDAIPAAVADRLIALASGILDDGDVTPFAPRLSLAVAVADAQVELVFHEHGGRPDSTRLVDRADRLEELVAALGAVLRVTTTDDGARLAVVVPREQPPL